MSRLIDADKILSTIADDSFGSFSDMDIIKIVDAVPTIDAVPVVHGHWKEREVAIGQKTIQEWQTARCSVCGKYHTTPYLYYFDDYEYCPHCGAKMDEVKE